MRVPKYRNIPPIASALLGVCPPTWLSARCSSSILHWVSTPLGYVSSNSEAKVGTEPAVSLNTTHIYLPGPERVGHRLCANILVISSRAELLTGVNRRRVRVHNLGASAWQTVSTRPDTTGAGDRGRAGHWLSRGLASDPDVKMAMSAFCDLRQCLTTRRDLPRKQFLECIPRLHRLMWTGNLQPNSSGSRRGSTRAQGQVMRPVPGHPCQSVPNPWVSRCGRQ